jgi:hypothetical protein
LGEREGEIERETPSIPADLLIQARCRNTIETGEVRIENDALAANDADER